MYHTSPRLITLVPLYIEWQWRHFYYSLPSVLATPCCGATNRKRRQGSSYIVVEVFVADVLNLMILICYLLRLLVAAAVTSVLLHIVNALCPTRWRIARAFSDVTASYLYDVWMSEVQSGEHEERLIEDIFQSRGYIKYARPVINETDALNVAFGISLQQIIDVVGWHYYQRLALLDDV